MSLPTSNSTFTDALPCREEEVISFTPSTVVQTSSTTLVQVVPLKYSSSKGKDRSKRKPMAKSANVHRLYEDAVQDTEGDVALVRRVFKKRFGRNPRLLREDFCGTAAMACEWVRTHR